MIKFSLRCSGSHEFEAWFASNDEFERLQADALVDCPLCGDSSVEKALMRPALRKSRTEAVSEGDGDRSAAVPASGVPAEHYSGGTPPQIDSRFREQLRQLRQAVTENAENVGERFPEEARKIHYGESERRGIYGRASAGEAKKLFEEGVDILPLPSLPEDRN